MLVVPVEQRDKGPLGIQPVYGELCVRGEARVCGRGEGGGWDGVVRIVEVRGRPSKVVISLYMGISSAGIVEVRQREGGSVVWLSGGCQGRDVLECLSFPDVLRHTWICRGRRWSVCPARLVDQVHSPLEQWVVGESGLLHASSMDFSLAEAHYSLYDGWDGIRAVLHTQGKTWLGWLQMAYRTDRSRQAQNKEGKTTR